MKLIRLRKTRPSAISITGLDESDCRLIAHALRAGSFQIDAGGPRSQAVERLADAFSVMAQFPARLANHDVIGGTVDANVLYEDVVNLRAAAGQ